MIAVRHARDFNSSTTPFGHDVIQSIQRGVDVEETQSGRMGFESVSFWL